MPNFKVISFMLPHKDDIKSTNLPYAGALVGSYYSPLLPIDNTKQVYDKSAYKTISKKWRASHSTLHNTTKQFMNEAGIDASDDMGLSKLMKTVRELFVNPRMKVMIHQIVNNALYVGIIANTYQLREIRRSRIPTYWCRQYAYTVHMYSPPILYRSTPSSISLLNKQPPLTNGYCGIVNWLKLYGQNANEY